MVWVIAFGSPDNFVMGPKVYVSEINSTYQAFGSGTNPATVTKSMGLPADALVVMVFASSSGQFYFNVTN